MRVSFPAAEEGAAEAGGLEGGRLILKKENSYCFLSNWLKGVYTLNLTV
jgi:hypothetical protein